MDCQFLLQEIFPTQESNLGLLHCKQILSWLSYKRSHVIWKKKAKMMLWIGSLLTMEFLLVLQIFIKNELKDLLDYCTNKRLKILLFEQYLAITQKTTYRCIVWWQIHTQNCRNVVEFCFFLSFLNLRALEFVEDTYLLFKYFWVLKVSLSFFFSPLLWPINMSLEELSILFLFLFYLFTFLMVYIGKLSRGHRTGKGQFSFQSQRKAMPKNAQTTTQLHSSHMLV